MTEFIPILVVAILVFAALFVTFGNIIVPSDTHEPVEIGPETFRIGESFNVSGAASTTKVATLNGAVSGGLISGADRSISFEVPNYAVASGGKIKFNVRETNLYGPLMIYVNGNNVYSEYPREGNHIASFNRDVIDDYTTLEFKAGSSGWRFWAPTIYRFESEVQIEYYGKDIETMDFDIGPDSFDNSTNAELKIDIGDSEGTGRMIVKINGFEIWRGKVDKILYLDNEVLNSGRNIVEISSEKNGRYFVNSVEVDILYR